jgi:hypothetical protein
MRALVALTVAMGILIVGGTSVLGVLIFRRLSVPASALPELSLDEPLGTRIAEIAAFGERLALRLEGGGPDRVLLIDPARARVIGHIVLAHGRRLEVPAAVP